MTRGERILSLLLNSFVVLLVLGSVAAFFLQGGRGNMKQRGAEALRYFTVESNLFCAAGCLCALIWEISTFGQGGERLPRWLDLLRFVGSVSVGVTFFTVLLILLPATRFDFEMMYAGRNLYLHGLCPLAAMGNWAYVEHGASPQRGWILLGLIPTVLYGAHYLRMVLLHQSWEDFYGFIRGRNWRISCLFMLGLSFAISAGLWALRMPG
ncbi:MAG: hypothetical protein IIY70_04605 [Oscillospiraceae bacterium]|nr:hypothetical protein [Oscillospiraceae bacterium]